MKFKQKFGWVSHIFGQNWIVPRYQNTGWWVSDLQKSKMQYSRPCVCNLVLERSNPAGTVILDEVVRTAQLPQLNMQVLSTPKVIFKRDMICDKVVGSKNLIDTK